MGKGTMAVAKASSNTQETPVAPRLNGTSLKGILRTAVAVACVPAVVTKDLVCSFASSALQRQPFDNYTQYGAGQYGVITDCDTGDTCNSAVLECRENATIFDNYARVGFWAAVGLGAVLITSVTAATAYACVRLRKKTQEANETEAARQLTTLERDFLQRKLDEGGRATKTPPIKHRDSVGSFDDIAPATYVNALRDGEGVITPITFKPKTEVNKDTYVDMKDGFDAYAEPDAWKEARTGVKRNARDPLPAIPTEKLETYQPVASFDDVPLTSYVNVTKGGASAVVSPEKGLRLKPAPSREEFKAKREATKQVQFAKTEQIHPIPARESPPKPEEGLQMVDIYADDEVGLATVQHVNEGNATYAVVVKPESSSAKISFHH